MVTHRSIGRQVTPAVRRLVRRSQQHGDPVGCCHVQAEPDEHGRYHADDGIDHLESDDCSQELAGLCHGHRPDSNHTLLAKNGGKINFNNCMVQVNTANWDAVESRDTSYIHSTNGSKLFLSATSTMVMSCRQKTDLHVFFTDPFASYIVPTNTCTYTNNVVTAPATLTPGTYCGGINISKDVTFSPGVYYIQDGDLTVFRFGQHHGQQRHVPDNRDPAISISPPAGH